METVKDETHNGAIAKFLFDTAKERRWGQQHGPVRIISTDTQALILRPEKAILITEKK